MNAACINNHTARVRLFAAALTCCRAGRAYPWLVAAPIPRLLPRFPRSSLACCLAGSAGRANPRLAVSMAALAALYSWLAAALLLLYSLLYPSCCIHAVALLAAALLAGIPATA